jgi:hypothetical protein
MQGIRCPFQHANVTRDFEIKMTPDQGERPVSGGVR